MRKSLLTCSLVVVCLAESVVCYSLTNKVNEKNEEITKVKKHNDELGNKNDELNDTNNSLEKDLKSTAKDVESLKVDLKEAKKAKKELEETKKDLNKKSASLSAENERLKEALKKKRADNGKAVEVQKRDIKRDVTTPSREKSSTPNQRMLTMEATAYTAFCEGCSGTTRLGFDLRANPNAKVVAVDPSVIPLGSTVEVAGYGYAVASDTGGAIKGNRIDLFMASETDARNFGRRSVTVKIIKAGG
ncbi:peptidase [Bacillus phage SP-10]|uniref:peptidase n=1 Tax=Bacillus phage SP10 TaxID=941058 RepID=UPI0002198B59|nr:peptidase [Bacillus phage SP-10]BAK52945.1 peptidoglycan-binding domain-containing protein [Bacillus phage SP-10]